MSQLSKPDIVKKRILSLDVLRGFDLIVLLCIGPLFLALASGPFAETFKESAFWQKALAQFHHVKWEGFVAWDLIMPLFLFMVGTALPFSLSKYKKSEGRSTFALYLRILRRVILLWILGMVAQGHLLDLKWQGLHFYSNTLQAIAAGYLIACILYLLFNTPGQILSTFVLLFAYWGAMTWIKVGDFGGGSFHPDTNLAEWIDRQVLGCWRDGVTFNSDGTWAFSSSYHYTWILSSLTFGVTVMLGVFAGEMIRSPLAAQEKEGFPENPTEQLSDEALLARLRSNKQRSVPLTQGKCFTLLMVIGAVLTLVGHGWAQIPEGMFGYCPLIKIIWTPSMTLFAGGLSFLLLGLFYAIFDWMGLRWGTTFFIVVGMNPITAYILPYFINFRDVAKTSLKGTSQYLGTWYTPMIVLAGFGLLWYILWVMYRNQKFLRV